MVKINFFDGSVKEFSGSISGFEIAKSISEGLLRQAICMKVDGELCDLCFLIEKDAKLEIITRKSPEALEVLRHTTEHVLTQAIYRLFPNAKAVVGPATKDGFFLDIDCDELEEEDFSKIEEEMQKIKKESLEIKKSILPKLKALKIFENNSYKKENIEEISKKYCSEYFKFYTQGEFVDLCKGPHLPNTSKLGVFKLETLRKVYLRGNSANKQITRVYGTAFWKKSDMDDYFKMLEEAKKRDHRVIGKKMELFMTHEYAPGMSFFLPRGYIIYKELQELIRKEYVSRNYKEVMTPNMFNKKLWEISGHWEHYKKDMFILEVDNQEFSLKPMNCPSHCLIFKNSSKSYKELPLRIADFGALHRDELSGTLSGLTRVRKFCQDDSHIFCSLDQIENEIDNVLKFVDYIYNEVFKMDYEIELSTRPDDFIGEISTWNKAEKSLEKAINRSNKKFEICEGDGSFYGPKIDFRLKDCLGRIWQTATIQLDFNLPERFNLKFTEEDGSLNRPVMIHRAVLGSIERFMGMMIEHFAGKFPLWLSPVQIKIINVADRHKNYCNDVLKIFKNEGFRVETNFDNEGVGKKIAMAREFDKPNYMLILGDKDIENKTISVRTRKIINGKNEEFTTNIREFLDKVKLERENKEIKD